MAWPYVSGDELAAYCRDTIEAELDFFAARALAASRAVNRWCVRTFVAPSGAATTRTYRPDDNDETVVVTHDLASLSGVAVTEDGTTVSASVLQWEPTNGIDWTGRTVPYMRVRHLDRPWVVDGRRALIGVTSAQWGWASVPEEVVEATLLLGKDLAHLRENRFGVAGYDSEMGVVRIRANPFIQLMLEDLRRADMSGVGSWVLS